MKRQYINPPMQLVMLQHQSHLLTVSGATQSLDNEEGFNLDPDDLDDSDILR